MMAASTFVRRALQNQQIGPQTILHLLISKLDQLRAGSDGEGERTADDFELRVRTEFGAQVGSLRTWRVAARPTDGSMPTQETIAQLFSSWIAESCRYPMLHRTGPSWTRGSRDFCNFGLFG
jgi:hypothetical protein